MRVRFLLLVTATLAFYQPFQAGAGAVETAIVDAAKAAREAAIAAKAKKLADDAEKAKEAAQEGGEAVKPIEGTVNAVSVENQFGGNSNKVVSIDPSLVRVETGGGEHQKLPNPGAGPGASDSSDSSTPLWVKIVIGIVVLAALGKIIEVFESKKA